MGYNPNVVTILTLLAFSISSYMDPLISHAFCEQLKPSPFGDTSHRMYTDRQQTICRYMNIQGITSNNLSPFVLIITFSKTSSSIQL